MWCEYHYPPYSFKTGSLLWFDCVWGEFWIILNFFVSMFAAFPTSQDWSQPLCARQTMADVARGNNVKDVRRRKRTERNGEKRRVSVSYLQRPCCRLLPGFSYFLSSLLLGTLHWPEMWLFDVLGLRLNNQPSLLLRSGTAGTNPADSTF